MKQVGTIIKLSVFLFLCYFNHLQANDFFNGDRQFLPTFSTNYVSHTEGKGIGYNDGYTTVGLFLTPSCTGRLQPFIDVRGHWFNNGDPAYNLGLGFRLFNQTFDQLFGINFFYDSYNRHDTKTFHQFGFGLEYLNSCFDLRLNAYFPIGDRSFHRTCTFFYPGGFIIQNRRTRDSLSGVDFEIGKCLYSGSFYCTCLDLYGALGPYYYHREHHRNQVIGGRVRLGVNFLKYFSLEISDHYDHVFGNGSQGLLCFTLPFTTDCCTVCDECSSPCYIAPMPVYRNDIMVLDKKRCCWSANF